jgi:hypothetical protein
MKSSPWISQPTKPTQANPNKTNAMFNPQKSTSGILSALALCMFVRHHKFRSAEGSGISPVPARSSSRPMTPIYLAEISGLAITHRACGSHLTALSEKSLENVRLTV